eukprot:1693836-Rhodomonas_salina.1
MLAPTAPTGRFLPRRCTHSRTRPNDAQTKRLGVQGGKLWVHRVHGYPGTLVRNSGGDPTPPFIVLSESERSTIILVPRVPG